ncbi:uncharacterized protein LOC135700284 [Ochlerotatus camptorhynchus]|uniref:uncharacterized protein LOC135700284 n=1 Tax=Ochlerotatus camptorhynchus TaxID=644619 RepID=UPI0031D20551
MESLLESSNRDFDENTRRVNNAVFISKEHHSSEDSGTEDSDSCSIVSALTAGTLRADEEHYYSDSSTSTAVGKPLPKRREYDPEAYQKWLKAKTEAERKRKEKELRRKKHEEIKRKLEEERRKQESEEKLKRWTERKEQEKQRKQQDPQNGNKRETQLRKKWVPNEESETTFKAWQDRIKQQEEERKRRLVAKQRMEEKFKKERQHFSKLVYDDWLKSSSSKPKPVPLNQGIASLQGSISKMYINPVPWKSNID